MEWSRLLRFLRDSGDNGGRSIWFNWESFTARNNSFEVWILLLRKEKWSLCRRLGRIMSTIEGTDGHTRCVRMWVQSKKGRTMIIQWPIQHLYSLEVVTTDKELKSSSDCTPNSTQEETLQEPITNNDTRRSSRSTAVEARDKIIACFTDWESVEYTLFNRGRMLCIYH